MTVVETLARAMYEGQTDQPRIWKTDLSESGRKNWKDWAIRTLARLDQLGHRIEYIPPEG